MPRPLTLLPLLALVLAYASCSDSRTGIDLPTTKMDPTDLVATISHGETVDLEDHLVPGTWTLLEFGADW